MTIRNARVDEHADIGKLMVEVYSQLKNFPTPTEQPAYYNMMANIGQLTAKPETEIIVAERDKELLGAVVYFGDIQYYGSGGTATRENNSAGFRFLAVASSARGLGAGKALTLECIARAQARKRKQVIIHTTKAMLNAWAMYEKIGFRRSEDLDFQHGDLSVFGFRYLL